MASDHSFPYGVVLVGGQSTRFGAPKAQIRISGETLVERINRLLTVVCRRPPLIVGGNELPDERPDNGPLSGIETAMKHCSLDHILVIAVDMPGIQPELLSLLAHHPSNADVVVPVHNNQLHPLCARWHTRTLSCISEALDSKQFGVQKLLESLTVRTIDSVEMRAGGIDPEQQLYNVNFPDDLDHFRGRRVR